MELQELINQYKECSDCIKKANYPKEWLDELVQRNKVIFSTYSTKAERQPLVDDLHKEFSDRFDAEIGEVKIPYDGNFYTLEEAEALLETLNSEVIEEESEEDRLSRIALSKQKQVAQAYLDSTDWYITRLTETGVEIPQDVLAKRAECREIL